LKFAENGVLISFDHDAVDVTDIAGIRHLLRRVDACV
jgi:hypothetical protein